MDRSEAKRIIEAILFSSEKPVAIEQIKEVLGDTESQEIRAILSELKSEYEGLGRSFKVCEVAGGFQMATQPEYGEHLKAFYKAKLKDRLTRPALETLAIIAYRQPITKASIEDIRGVNVDGVIRTLAERSLIRIIGRKDAPGRPIIYGTTKEFLDRFGLNSLSELPVLPDVKEADVDLGQAAADTRQAGATESGAVETGAEEIRDGAGEITQEDR